jgi:type II secretory pathway pseudopilin PulG
MKPYNRFWHVQNAARVVETAQAVQRSCACSVTPLKRGVNETAQTGRAASGTPLMPCASGLASGFTMIEIALSLAVIGFALVAIIGILPSGMTAQKESRQETIVSQDATIFIDAIRNGERGLDDLTNYVLAITNTQSVFRPNGTLSSTHTYGYTRTSSTRDNSPTPTPFWLTNGLRIVGLLSTPKYMPIATNNSGFYSNHVAATISSMSGPASEKFPQANPIMQDMALQYRLIPEVVPYDTNYFDPIRTNFTDPLIINNTNEITRRSNYFILVKNYQTNYHDLRLTFRWPILPNGNVGQQRQSYRTVVSGLLQNTFDSTLQDAPTNLFFFQPRTYLPYKGS